MNCESCNNNPAPKDYNLCEQCEAKVLAHVNEAMQQILFETEEKQFEKDMSKVASFDDYFARLDRKQRGKK